MNKEVKAALISGICVIIAAIIGVFSININIENDKLKEISKSIESENAKLSKENIDLKKAYTELEGKFDELNIKNASLSIEIDDLNRN